MCPQCQESNLSCSQVTGISWEMTKIVSVQNDTIFLHKYLHQLFTNETAKSIFFKGLYDREQVLERNANK